MDVEAPPTNDPARAAGASAWAERLQAIPRVRKLSEVATPFLVVDLDTLEANIERMQRLSDARAGGLAPHVKSHKCSMIARRQFAAGAAAVTCATPDEVVAMIGAGISPVILASVVTDHVRLGRLVDAATSARVVVAVDSPDGGELLARAARSRNLTLEVVIECDVGMGRNGVADLEEGLQLAAQVDALDGLTLAGVMAYEGHLIDIVDRAERASRSLAAFAWPLELLRELRRSGFEAEIFTGGSTATHDSTGALPELTHLQAGTYALMDPIYRELTPEFDPALAIVATVLTHKGDRLVLDFGAKRSGEDWGSPMLLSADGEHVYTAEEHVVFRLSERSSLTVGERVAVLPPHSCTTMNLYSRVFGCRGGRLTEILEIDARDPLI